MAAIETALKSGDVPGLVRMAEARVDRRGVRRDLLVAAWEAMARAEGDAGRGLLVRLEGLVRRMKAEALDLGMLDEAEAQWAAGGDGALLRLASWWEARELGRTRDRVRQMLEAGLAARVSGDAIRPVLEDLIREVGSARGKDAAWVEPLALRVGSGSRLEVEQTAAWWKEQGRTARLLAAVELLKASGPDPSRADPDFRFRRMALDLAGQDAVRADQVAAEVEEYLRRKSVGGREALGAWYAERFLPKREVDLMLTLDAGFERHPHGVAVGEAIALSLRSGMGSRKTVRFDAAARRAGGTQDPAEEAAMLGARAVAKLRVVRADVDSDRSAVLQGSTVSRAVVEVEVKVGGRAMVLREEVQEIRSVTPEELVRMAIEKALKRVVWPPWVLNPEGS